MGCSLWVAPMGGPLGSTQLVNHGRSYGAAHRAWAVRRSRGGPDGPTALLILAKIVMPYYLSEYYFKSVSLIVQIVVVLLDGHMVTGSL